MSETTDTSPEGAQAGADEEIVPDYSRVGFRDLQKLCKVRGLPGDCKGPELIERLKAYDAQHGRKVDLTLPEGEEVDLLADDDDTPERPAGTGEAAPEPVPVGSTLVYVDGPGFVTGDGGTVTSAAPAVIVYADADQPTGLPLATTRGGKADLSVRNGAVKVGQGHGAAEVRAYRMEYPHGPREVTDNDHFTYIAETHAAAQAAGHETKGGVTIGERVGFGADADGRRTVVYQVPLKRQK